MNSERIGLVIGGGIITAAGVVAARVALGHMPVMMLATLRLLIGGLTLLAAMAILRKPLPRDGKTWWHLFVGGALNMGWPVIGFTLALTVMSSGVSSIFTSLVPLFTAIIAHFVLHEEKLTPLRIGGLVLALGGALVLVFTNTTGLVEQQGPVWWAYALAFTAALAGAIGAVYTRRNLTGVDPMAAATGLAFGGLVLVIPFLLIPGSFALAEVTVGEWWATFLSGFLSAGVGYLVFLVIVQKHGATIATFTGYVITIAAALLGAWLLKEQITPIFVLGGVMILGGVYLVSK